MKGIIVAAGYGSRFWPITKSVPKEMLPIGCRPIIDFIVDEFVDSGIDDILVITSPSKPSLQSYFEHRPDLEAVAKRRGDLAASRSLIPPVANITFVQQTQTLGSGHALMLAAQFVGDDIAVAAYPDDLHIGSPPLSRQLIDAWRSTGLNVLATRADLAELHRYGVVTLRADGRSVSSIVEKPPIGTAPSKYVSIGRYLYQPQFFEYLVEGWRRHKDAGKTGEYFHIEALQRLMDEERVIHCPASGLRLDVGDPASYLASVARYAMLESANRKILLDVVNNG